MIKRKQIKKETNNNNNNNNNNNDKNMNKLSGLGVHGERFVRGQHFGRGAAAERKG